MVSKNLSKDLALKRQFQKVACWQGNGKASGEGGPGVRPPGERWGKFPALALVQAVTERPPRVRGGLECFGLVKKSQDQFFFWLSI
jgi:hypothetical protein